GLYIKDDMERMGTMLEYSDYYSYDYAGVKTSRYLYAKMFLNSLTREAMDGCHPYLLSANPYEVYVSYVEDVLKGSIDSFVGEDLYKGCIDVYKWVGMFYAYIHGRTGMLTKDIVRLLNIDSTLEYFSIGHQMSFENAMLRAADEVGNGKIRLL
ncbi:MAG: hypothetical protein Q4B57_08550, partial [Eubacteriales bacterium]|nr:hypothetical protein [Eubacteriales bacterium]